MTAQRVAVLLIVCGMALVVVPVSATECYAAVCVDGRWNPR